MEESDNIATDTDNYDYYYISGDQFLKADGSLQIDAYRACLRVAKSADASDVLNINGEDLEDGIRTAGRMDNQQSGNAYNIMGIRVGDSYKGVVIKNGKKYFVK